MSEDIVKLLSWPSCYIILVFDTQRRYPIPRGTPSAGAHNTREWVGGKILQFSTEITVYLGNTRYSHSYYRTPIGSHRRSIEWYQVTVEH